MPLPGQGSDTPHVVLHTGHTAREPRETPVPEDETAAGVAESSRGAGSAWGGDAGMRA